MKRAPSKGKRSNGPRRYQSFPAISADRRRITGEPYRTNEFPAESADWLKKMAANSNER